jgi:hypothetical protein
MRLPAALRSAATAVTALVVLLAAPGTAHAAQVQSYAGDFPDPSIVTVKQKNGSTVYYAYATQVPDGSSDGWRSVQVMQSKDLRSWTSPTEALPTLGAWAMPGHTWAPAVTRIGSRYFLYYTAKERTSLKQCVGVARSTSPAGPFTDVLGTPLVCQRERGGSMDAETFRTATGDLYLHWKSDEETSGGISGLWGQQLASDGTRFASGTTPTLLLRYSQAWETPLIEGPQMVRAGTGSHHLFYGGGHYATEGAAVGYATCAGPLGPCTKATLDRGWLRADAQRVGPAGAAFFQRNGAWLVGYHGWQPGKASYELGGRRSLWLNDVSFASGAPVLVP